MIKADLTKKDVVWLTPTGLGYANRKMRATCDALGISECPVYNNHAVFMVTDLLEERRPEVTGEVIALRYPDRGVAFSIPVEYIESIV